VFIGGVGIGGLGIDGPALGVSGEVGASEQTAIIPRTERHSEAVQQI